MMDWRTNQPNARFWVLKLLKDTFHPGDRLVKTELDGSLSNDVSAQAFVTPRARKLLLVNRRNRAIDIPLPDAQETTALAVDLATADGPARNVKPVDGKIKLEPFAVTVVSW